MSWAEIVRGSRLPPARLRAAVEALPRRVRATGRLQKETLVPAHGSAVLRSLAWRLPPASGVHLSLFQKAPARSACAALLTLLACSPEAPPGAAAYPRELRIVAHEDDDLLFMNPDLAESIAAGHPVRTVFLTAGDAGEDAAYWTARESGMLEAYAAMASVPNSWATSTIQVTGRTVQVRSLAGLPRVSLVFLRLPDGNARGQGFPATDGESLAGLWSESLEVLHPVDGAPGYTRKELIRLVRGLMTEFQAQTIDTQDWSGRFHGDHSDHVAAGRIARAAERGYRGAHTTRVYRGYNQRGEPLNLLPAQQELKERIFLAYAAYDGLLCATGARCAARADYRNFLGRQYPYLPGALVGPGGKCLEAVRGAVAMRGCRDLPAQQWSMKGKELENALGGCLSAPERDDGASPLELTVEACGGRFRQGVSLGADGRLRMTDGSCATLAVGGPVHGSEIFETACGDVPVQKWRLYPDASAR